jgi:hypothetical protein
MLTAQNKTKEQEFINYAEILLERRDLGVRAKVPQEFLYNTELKHYADHVTQSLILELHKSIYAHNVKTKERAIPWSAIKTVEATRKHRLKTLVVFCALSAALLIMPNILLALVALAITTIFALSERQVIKVEGETLVRDQHWNLFPVDTTIYPDGMGPAIRLVTTESLYPDSGMEYL